MKRILFFVFVFGCLQLFSQNSDKFILRANAGYSFSHKDMFDLNTGTYYPTVFGQIDKAFFVNLNAGRKLGKCFYYGAGMYYNTTSQVINPGVDEPDSNSPDPWKNIYSYTRTESKNNTISPYVGIEYYKMLSERFEFALDGFIKYDFGMISKREIYFYKNNIVYPFISETEHYKETHFQKLAVGIRPSIRFEVIKSLGLDFNFGMLQYSFKTKDSSAEGSNTKSSVFEYGFSPQYWLLGIYLKL
jgi:hypothetical protein